MFLTLDVFQNVSPSDFNNLQPLKQFVKYSTLDVFQDVSVSDSKDSLPSKQ